jgi:hypothetical protein
MKRLTEIGFKKVGTWILTNGSFNHTITNHLTEKDLLYSFICEKVVFYIGKTTDTLKNRMNGYKNAGGSQKTNIRVKAKLMELLEDSKFVDIYILLDDINLKYKSYNISLASGLEDNLIAAIKPKWNFRGNNRIKEQELPGENESVIIENLPHFVNKTKTVEITLGQEYWNKGFFNFSKNELLLLPNKRSDVTLLLGQNEDFLTAGHFHFATQENQPRVRGNKGLKQWLQDNYKQGDKVKIDILKPDLYRIY